MKKILSIFLLQFFLFSLAFAAATINSKQGYAGLAWGSTIHDAMHADYKLTQMDTPNEIFYLSKLYTQNDIIRHDIVGYTVTPKDKKVSALQFHYYKGKLFFVTEMLNSNDFSLQNLEARYGNFAKQGISLTGNQYTDAKLEKDGSVSSLSITISNSSGKIITKFFDWNVYKNISFAGQKLSQTKGNIDTKGTIVDELNSITSQLVQEKKGNDKPSFAFLALTTDYKNTLVDNYVTDALTEAMFKTGKVKIIERANLEAILEEQKFQASGLVNEATAKSIGMIAGVDFVCYGNIKDLGNTLTVNARVVDVETGELCAISRATITKDEYLRGQSQSAVGSAKTGISSVTAKTNATTPPKTTVPVANNAWKVTKYRNDFDGFTQYIFRVYSTDHRFVFISYKKCDIKANSRVIAGVHWNDGGSWDSTGTYDVKSKEGTVTKNYNDYWEQYLDSSQKEKFTFVWNQKEGSRTLTERFKNNESVALRRDNLVRKFQTAGLMDKMTEYGITWQEIDAALSNEEF